VSFIVNDIMKLTWLSYGGKKVKIREKDTPRHECSIGIVMNEEKKEGKREKREHDKEMKTRWAHKTSMHEVIVSLVKNEPSQMFLIAYGVSIPAFLIFPQTIITYPKLVFKYIMYLTPLLLW